MALVTATISIITYVNDTTVVLLAIYQLPQTSRFPPSFFTYSATFMENWPTCILLGGCHPVTQSTALTTRQSYTAVSHSNEFNQTLVVWHPNGATTWQILSKYNAIHDSDPLTIWYETVASSTKPEVLNILKCHWIWPQETCTQNLVMIGYVVFELCKQTANILITILPGVK